jgi:hypothetical protein
MLSSERVQQGCQLIDAFSPAPRPNELHSMKDRDQHMTTPGHLEKDKVRIPSRILEPFVDPPGRSSDNIQQEID